MLDEILLWDQQAFQVLNGMGTPAFDAFWVTVTRVATWTPLYLFFFLMVFRTYPWREALPVAITLLLLVLTVTQLTDWVKEAAERLRPNNDPMLQGVIRVLREPVDYSFFSGHASFSFAATTAVVLFTRKKYRWVYIFFIWPLLFAFSRIYVGVHYPGDILIGASCGALLAYVFYRGHQYIKAQYKP